MMEEDPAVRCGREFAQRLRAIRVMTRHAFDASMLSAEELARLVSLAEPGSVLAPEALALIAKASPMEQRAVSLSHTPSGSIAVVDLEPEPRPALRLVPSRVDERG